MLTTSLDWVGLSQEFAGFGAQLARELLDYIDGRRILAALEATHIGPIDISTVGKLLLRQPPSRTVSSQIFCQDLAQRHRAEWPSLQSI